MAPIVTLIIGLYLIVAPLVTNPTLDYLYVLAALVMGFVFYIAFVYYRWTLGCMGKLQNA